MELLHELVRNGDAIAILANPWLTYRASLSDIINLAAAISSWLEAFYSGRVALRCVVKRAMQRWS
jgi:hypothetical protein